MIISQVDISVDIGQITNLSFIGQMNKIFHYTKTKNLNDILL